jgi:hypothetical protein
VLAVCVRRVVLVASPVVCSRVELPLVADELGPLPFVDVALRDPPGSIRSPLGVDEALAEPEEDPGAHVLPGSVLCRVVLPREDPALADCEGEPVLEVGMAEPDSPSLEDFTAQAFYVSDAAFDAAATTGRIVQVRTEPRRLTHRDL